MVGSIVQLAFTEEVIIRVSAAVVDIVGFAMREAYAKDSSFDSVEAILMLFTMMLFSLGLLNIVFTLFCAALAMLKEMASPDLKSRLASMRIHVSHAA
mmetsp:Transcript_22128/g.34702  ORF Transcript_22128/g.34702 Transcript_22128/m.34702 type:complete len:98 (-) Transcript_22128:84-377(-)